MQKWGVELPYTPMDRHEQIEHFEIEIGKVIARFRKEYEIPYASIIGVLQIKAHDLCQEALGLAEDAEEEKT